MKKVIIFLIAILFISFRVDAQITDPNENPTQNNNEGEFSKGEPEEIDFYRRQKEDLEKLAEVKKNNIKKFQSNVYGYQLFSNNNFDFYYQVDNSVTVNDDYILGPGDDLVVNLWGKNDILSDQFRISSSGYIQQDDWGRLYLRGLSLGQAKEVLYKKYIKEYNFNKEDFEVSLVGAKVINVEVIGEVIMPGTYTVSAINTPFNLLNRVGGPMNTGSLRNITLSRGGQEILNLDVYKYLNNKLPGSDKYLQDGDVLFVSRQGNVVNIEGQVKRPAKYELLKGETYYDILNYAGGFKSDALKDQFQLKRFDNNKYVIEDIYFDPNRPSYANTKLEDGDNILVKSVSKNIEDFVEITGAVKQPGSYGYIEGMTILDLIELSDGLTYSALKTSAYVTRLDDNLEKVKLSFDLNTILENPNSVENLELYPKDVISIFDKSKLSNAYKVSIFGAVNNPGSYNFGNSMTLQDLLLLSGGFGTNALSKRIELHRVIDYDEEEGRIKPVRNKVKTINIDYNFLDPNNESAKIELRPNDQIFVRSYPDLVGTEIVSILGEVTYPGKYPLSDRNMRISDLIKVSGGLNQYAYTHGAKFIRKLATVAKKEIIGSPRTEKRISENTYYTSIDTLTNSFPEIKETFVLPRQQIDILEVPNNYGQEDLKSDEYLIVLDLQKILRNENSPYNYVLQPGDRLIIPTVDEVVKIQGAIQNKFIDQQGVNTAFVGKKNAKWYINNYAAGFDGGAWKRTTQVIYPSGKSVGTKKFLFINTYPQVTPGSEIIVQYKPPKDPKKGKFFEDLTAERVLALIGTLTTTTALIIAVSRNN